MNIINLPDWAKGMYGFDKNEFGKDSTNALRKNSKYDQKTMLASAIWEQPDKKKNYYEFMPVKLGDVQLWNPIIRITARKTVIETPMVESSGSVKEIIQIDDYIINIRGGY